MTSSSYSRRYGIPEDRTETIPLALFERSAHEPVAGSQKDVCRLLYLGIIRPFKGVEDLVRAFDLLERRGREGATS